MMDITDNEFQALARAQGEVGDAQAPCDGR